VLDVVVTKGSGGAMTGLGKQDFEVSEDGKAQSIDFFEEHSAKSRVFDAPPAMPELPADYRTNVPLPAPLDSVNVLLLDGLNTEQPDQAYFYHQILEFLKKLQPGTRVAIFTLGSKLRMVQGFTTDTSALIAALNDQKHGVMPEKMSRGRGDDADETEAITNLQAMRASPFAIEAMRDSQAGAGARDFAARAAMTFQALDYLAHYLSGIPGRKNLIWFASSFPVVIFPTVKQRESIKQNPNMPGYMDQINTTADLFTAGKIAIYPIDASGVMTEHVAEADTSSPVPSPTGVGHIGNLAPDTNMSPYSAGAGQRAQVVNAMEQLAASTGGKAFYNTNDLNGAMQKAIDDGANYYTLGYSPIDKTMDGSFRRIDVRVTSGKYKLAYRRGYNAEERPAADAQPAVNPLAALLEYGLPGATGVLYGVAVKAGPTEEASPSNRAGANTALQGIVTRYRVDFTIRVGDVELKPNAQGGQSGRILLGLKVYDRDGNAVNWEGDDQSLDLKESDYGALVKNGIPAHLMLDLPANVQGHLITAVYDWNSGRAGTLNVPIGVGNSR
jgi:VWFA-related protein